LESYSPGIVSRKKWGFMKTAYLALSLTLATLAVGAEELNFTQNLPIECNGMIENETPMPSYDHKMDIGLGLFGIENGISYSRIKPASAYFGVGTSIRPLAGSLTVMGGYNFRLSQKDTLTAAVGVSYVPRYRPIFLVFGMVDHRLFPVAGVGYEHAFNNVFSLGVDFASIIDRYYSYGVGVPFIFHFGATKKWDIRLIPSINGDRWGLYHHFRQLNGSIGYRF